MYLRGPHCVLRRLVTSSCRRHVDERRRGLFCRRMEQAADTAEAAAVEHPETD